MTRGGTGKTYASAFAMREMNYNRVLFLVHREQILKQAVASYKKVMPDTVSMGLLSGNYKEVDSDYLFSTVQTMSRDYVLEKFDKNRFECIVIDETHKKEAEAAKWLKKSELDSVQWLPADLTLIEKIKENMVE